MDANHAAVRQRYCAGNRALLQFVATPVQSLSMSSTFSSTGHTGWSQLERLMRISFTTRLASIALAALLTVVTNGTMLMSFNTTAQNASLEQAERAHTVVTLDTVTVVAHQS